jgi:hypothetical protein
VSDLVTRAIEGLVRQGAGTAFAFFSVDPNELMAASSSAPAADRQPQERTSVLLRALANGFLAQVVATDALELLDVGEQLLWALEYLEGHLLMFWKEVPALDVEASFAVDGAITVGPAPGLRTFSPASRQARDGPIDCGHSY